MAFSARQVLTAAALNDLSITSLTTTGDVTVGGTLTATLGAISATSVTSTGDVTAGGSLIVNANTNTSGSATGSTLLTLTNDVGADLSQQKTFIDFVFLDDNSNEIPQVRIGAEVGQDGDANTQEKEGSGAFLVYTNNADTTSGAAGASLIERMRINYNGITSFANNVNVTGTLQADVLSSYGGIGGTRLDVQQVYAGAFITSSLSGDTSGSNIDHIWHNDTTNTWHFVSDSTYTANGNSKLQAGDVVAGSVLATDGGDGGFVLRAWTGNGAFASLCTNNMTGAEYCLICDGNNTFLSSATNGSVILRGGANDTNPNITVSPTMIYVDTQTWQGNITWNNGVNIVCGGECSFDLSSGDAWGTWDGNYAIRHTYGQTVEIGASGSRGLSVIGNLVTTGEVIGIQSGNSSFYYNQAIQSESDGERGGLACRNYNSNGSSMQIRPSSNIAYFRTYNNGTGITIKATTFSNDSTLRNKQDIVDWGATPSVGAMSNAEYAIDAVEMVRNLRPVKYRVKTAQSLPAELHRSNPRRQRALDRLNDYKRSKGEDLYETEETIHLCGRDCEHTPENPCRLVRDWQRGHVGFVAEEVASVVPDAVQRDDNDDPESLDLMAFIALCVKAIQQIDTRLTSLGA